MKKTVYRCCHIIIVNQNKEYYDEEKDLYPFGNLPCLYGGHNAGTDRAGYDTTRGVT